MSKVKFCPFATGQCTEERCGIYNEETKRCSILEISGWLSAIANK